MSLGDFWIYAQPEDCDEFTELMLTSWVVSHEILRFGDAAANVGRQMGVDAVNHFLSGDSSVPADFVVH